MGEPTRRVPPLTQKSGSDTPCFPSSDGLPTSNLVMHLRTSEGLDQQSAVALQDLSMQILKSSLAASPERQRHPNRTRTMPPITAPAPSPRTRGHHHHRQRGQMVGINATFSLNDCFIKQISFGHFFLIQAASHYFLITFHSLLC